MGKWVKGIPQSILRSWVNAGQRAWLQPSGCTLMECWCPISGRQGWGRARTGTKRESKNRKDHLILWLENPIYYRRLYIVVDKQWQATTIGQG